MRKQSSQNKKSFFEEIKTEPKVEVDKAKSFIVSYFKGILNITQGISKPKAVEEIKENISFRGYHAWILIFSIIIASIGLNSNSVAVVIGAMLISPLMGPIVGIGYSVGVNDYETLKRSLMNLFVMIIISLATSFLYFSLNPLSEITTNELLARTSPTILDVFIAIFGGLSGAVALTRQEKSNVVPGVAIATALMPPLCTAGYGLAVSNWTYFWGAIYLFFINSVFIALTTLFIIKILRFPLAKYQDIKKRRRTNIVITVIAIVTLIPSTIFFINAMQETLFKTRTVNFIRQQIITNFPESNFIYDTDKDFHYHRDTISYVTLWNSGKRVSEDIISLWNHQIRKEPYNQRVQLLVRQDADVKKELSRVKEGVIRELLFDQKNTIARKDSLINVLKKEIVNRKNVEQNAFPEVIRKAKVLFPMLNYFGYAMLEVTRFQGDSYHLPTIVISWEKMLDGKEKLLAKSKLTSWLKVELKVDTLQIIEK